MGYTPEAAEIVRRKRQEGKQPVLINTADPFWTTFTGERTSVRTITRRAVAFLTPQEYAQWRAQRTAREEG